MSKTYNSNFQHSTKNMVPVVKVVPKYELVSFNLRCFEKILNRKLKLDKQTKGTQTDLQVLGDQKESHKEMSIMSNAQLKKKLQNFTQDSGFSSSLRPDFHSRNSVATSKVHHQLIMNQVRESSKRPETLEELAP
mmetsp:Transcript_4387/g.4141  ORF Transcript_4387/g.4141 Transcript_4387/m.4141 type:complete len:135 (-) Transcript_4387:359-763(-)